VYVEPLHDSGTQVLPAVYLRQAPAPSQKPSFPQDNAESCVHSLSGSVPPTIGRQRPSAWAVLAAEQAKQPLAHPDSQQTPSVQELLEHSSGAPQAAPVAFSVTQLPADEQKKPDAQSSAEAQDVLHAEVPHTYGLHGSVDAAWHVPVPLHILASVCVEPRHDSPTQVVVVPQ